jgi:hypothetical protein
MCSTRSLPLISNTLLLTIFSITSKYTTSPKLPSDKPCVLPPPEPPPRPSNNYFPPVSLIDEFIRSSNPLPISMETRDKQVTYFECRYYTENSAPPSLVHDSIIHLVGLPWVCGLWSDDTSSIRIAPEGSTCSMVDGSSNVCITGDLDV